MMTFEAAQLRTFTVRLDCHYLLHLPDNLDSESILAVTLHGYGANPDTMLRLTGNLLGPRHVIAALEGPSQFYLKNTPGSEVGFSWLTNKHAESSIRLHHDMVLHVLDEAGRECGIPAERRLLAGFSQAVGINYRFAATHPAAVRGLIGICGGLPKNWEDGPYQQVSASLLHIARREDEFYPPAVTELYPERLKKRAGDVEFHLLEGGHRMPSKASPVVERWIKRVFGRA